MKHILFDILVLLAIPLMLATVNINTATAAELEALPGIDPAKTKTIATYRQQNGQSKTMEGLKRVKGIGEDVFSKLKDEASVAPPAAKRAIPAVKRQ